MSDDVIERMRHAFNGACQVAKEEAVTGGDVLFTWQNEQRAGMKAAARVLLEAQRKWMHSTMSVDDASYLAVLPSEFAVSIGIDLTSTPSPAQEAAPAAGTDRTGQEGA